MPVEDSALNRKQYSFLSFSGNTEHDRGGVDVYVKNSSATMYYFHTEFIRNTGVVELVQIDM